MSLSTLAVAVLSLSTSNACLDARSLAEDIARARDAGTPITHVLTVMQGNELWTDMTRIIYSYPELPPVALGIITESACRDNS